MNLACYNILACNENANYWTIGCQWFHNRDNHPWCLSIIDQLVVYLELKTFIIVFILHSKELLLLILSSCILCMDFAVGLSGTSWKRIDPDLTCTFCESLFSFCNTWGHVMCASEPVWDFAIGQSGTSCIYPDLSDTFAESDFRFCNTSAMRPSTERSEIASLSFLCQELLQLMLELVNCRVEAVIAANLPHGLPENVLYMFQT